MSEQIEPSDPSVPRRVLVADADPDVRAALCLLLRREPEVRLVGQTGDPQVLLTLAAAERPDIVVLDWTLAEFHNGDILARLRAMCPGAVILALSVRPEQRVDVLARGIQTFVSKADAPAQVLAAVRAAAASVRKPRAISSSAAEPPTDQENTWSLRQVFNPPSR
jgi:DNA-binding NarL/FixJ family response regulator